jgi:hypothetical protein
VNDRKPQRRPRLWLALSVPSFLLAVIFATIANYFYAVVLTILTVALMMRAWEERDKDG